MQDVQNTGVTLPKDLIKKVDKIRGDVPRSRFIRRLLEKVCIEAGMR
jgi:metal-responsive CopG/Arc/MetJ family transcriptional regulator